MMIQASTFELGSVINRYLEGTCRDRILFDLILADVDQFESPVTMLDIGCGRGFDSDERLQKELVHSVTNYIGVEPDESVKTLPYLKDVRRCFFEEVNLAPNSVHLAFAIMVLEHLEHPQPFWDKLYEILVPGGVFWAMTVDSRHWFCRASLWSERLRVKNMYLDWLMGERGTQRYENYPVYYRCNTPEAVQSFATSFSSVECLNLKRVGQCDPIFPKAIQPLSRLIERCSLQRNKPGTLFLIRVKK